MKRVKILGDHSKLHCGCKAVMDYLHSLLQNQYIIVTADDDFDILLVNGEGSMHDNAKDHKNKLNAIKAAQQQGKLAYLINSVWQNNNKSYDNVLKQIPHIVVRENASKRDLYLNHGIESLVRLDLSYSAAIAEEVKVTHFSMQPVITDFYAKEFGGWVKFTAGGAGKAKHPYLDMKKFTWAELVNSLKTASMLITGRHHAVFAACKARIPFVALESNTHKISGFVNMAKMPIPICDNPRQLTQAIKWAQENPAVYQEFFDFLDEQPKFTLADIGL
ncbi:polysaccharide pyruvyl transferase family protein [Alishewanella longhuensis]